MTLARVPTTRFSGFRWFGPGTRDNRQCAGFDFRYLKADRTDWYHRVSIEGRKQDGNLVLVQKRHLQAIFSEYLNYLFGTFWFNKLQTIRMIPKTLK